MYFESRCEHHVAHHVAQFCVEIEYLTASLGCSQIYHFLPLFDCWTDHSYKNAYCSVCSSSKVIIIIIGITLNGVLWRGSMTCELRPDRHCRYYIFLLRF